MFRNDRLYRGPRPIGKYIHGWLGMAVICLGTVSVTAKADDIVFHDRQDQTRVTKTPPEGTAGETISVEGAFGFADPADKGQPFCSGEICSITIRGENNFQFAGVTSRYPFTKVDENHYYMTITEGNGYVSDVVLLDTSHASETDVGATLIFLSDTRGPLSSLSRFQVLPGSPVENGRRQQLFSLSWHDPGSSTTDTATIIIRSDRREK